MARTIAFVPDLFFKARITATALERQADVAFASSAESLVARASESPVALVLVDLHAPHALDVVRAARRAAPGARIVGFLSHVATDLRRDAEQAGVDEALPRSAFVERLPAMLARTREV